MTAPDPALERDLFEQRLASAPFSVLLLVIVLGVFVAGLLLALLGEASPWRSIIGISVTHGSALVWVILCVPRAGFGARQLLGDFPRARVWWWVCGALATCELAQLGLNTLEFSFWPPPPSLLIPDYPTSLAAALEQLFVALTVAPVVEELTFRGVLFRKWRYTRGPVFGLLVSSALFGAAHPHHVLSGTAFGVILALLYTRTRSLWPPILVHMLHNATVMALHWSSERITEASALDALAEIAESPGTTLALLVLGLPALFTYIWLTRGTLRAQLPPFVADESGAGQVP